ncbi:MAG: hypothetical protein IJQ02_16050 [Oscillospiraceae bacterium]|nr:hypothetical protein [Oscillospiraceae bacterium]
MKKPENRGLRSFDVHGFPVKCLKKRQFPAKGRCLGSLDLIGMREAGKSISNSQKAGFTFM